jgi:hypothetical protein
MIEFWATVRPPCAAAAKETSCWSGSPEQHCPMLIPASDDSADRMTRLFSLVGPSPGIRRDRPNEPYKAELGLRTQEIEFSPAQGEETVASWAGDADMTVLGRRAVGRYGRDRCIVLLRLGTPTTNGR